MRLRGKRRPKGKNIAPDPENNLRLEIGHVLFIDLVGSSKLLIEEQKERLRQAADRGLEWRRSFATAQRSREQYCNVALWLYRSLHENNPRLA